MGEPRVGISYGYPVTRENRQWFKGRHQYIVGRSETDDSEMCHVMEQAARTRRPPTPDDPWIGFPWLTLVLGSGTLAIADEPGLNSTSLAARVLSLVEADVESSRQTSGQRLGVKPDISLSYASQASAFTAALVRDRMLEADDAPPGDGDWEVEPVAARLILLAALLTNWFDQVRAATSAPLSRWDDDEAVLPASGSVTSQLPHLADEVLEPALDVMELVLNDLKAGRTQARAKVAAAVTRLLDLVSSGLQPRRGQPARLRIEHLRLVTEVCWHFLLVRTSVYPGWTDLLLGLMLHENSDEDFRRARPRYRNLRNLPDAVRDLVSPPTERSWQLSRPDPGIDVTGPRDHLYRTVAEVLWAESDVKATHSKAPPPTTFVTSFDIEAEMGLWSTGLNRLAAGQAAAFNVVVPVHLVRDRESEEAEPCWLLGEVVPDPELSWDDQLSTLRRPARWKLLTDDTIDHARLWRRPTVVHLSGCPLFELPALADPVHGAPLVDELRTVGVVGLDVKQAELIHAVTVDEYLALRQAEAEFFWHGTSKASAGVRTGRGMPKELAKNSDTNPRFWMAIGVPIGDPAVRHRLVAQITLLRMFGEDEPPTESSRSRSALSGGRSKARSEAPIGPDSDPEPLAVASARPAATRSDVDGVVVNRRVNDDEASLLYWLGFDVVRDDCQSFVPDLEHYVDHLRADPRDVRTSPTAQCPIVSIRKRGDA